MKSTRWQNTHFALKQIAFRPGLSVRVQEMPILCNLRHPNVINLYDYFDSDNCVSLILEYCLCGSLMGLIRSFGALPYDKLRRRIESRTET
jgi:serine/threonine protein kinase